MTGEDVIKKAVMSGYSRGRSSSVSPHVAQPTQEPASSDMISRMIRAAKLDASLYEEVERDPEATGQALLVVVIASICSGIGTGLGSLVRGLGVTQLTMGLVSGVFLALLGWIVWSFITYFIGTRIFAGPETEATYGELLRCIGFSDSPVAPLLGGFITFIAWIWSLVAMIIAVRQALDFTTVKAILTCVVGWIAMVIIIAIFGLLFAIPFLMPR